MYFHWYKGTRLYHVNYHSSTAGPPHRFPSTTRVVSLSQCSHTSTRKQSCPMEALLQMLCCSYANTREITVEDNSSWVQYLSSCPNYNISWTCFISLRSFILEFYPMGRGSGAKFSRSKHCSSQPCKKYLLTQCKNNSFRNRNMYYPEAKLKHLPS